MNPPLDNPFAPPEATVAPARPDDAQADFFALFVLWERYRLIYNAILALETLLGLAFVPWRSPIMLLSVLVEGAIAANVCFCAGLVLNGYAWWLGFRGRIIGVVICGVGTLLAMGLAWAALLTLSMLPGMD